MSRWVRGIYNAAANFVMSGSLRAASGSTMDRNRKLVREISNKPNKCDESCKSDECDRITRTCDCHSSRTCDCSNGECADSDIDRDYNEYIEHDKRDEAGNKARNEDRNKHTYVDPEFGGKSSTAGSIRTEGQGAGSGIRFSNEPRNT